MYLTNVPLQNLFRRVITALTGSGFKALNFVDALPYKITPVVENVLVFLNRDIYVFFSYRNIYKMKNNIAMHVISKSCRPIWLLSKIICKEVSGVAISPPAEILNQNSALAL